MSKLASCLLLLGFLVGPVLAQDKDAPPKDDPAPVKKKPERKKEETVAIQGTLTLKDPTDKSRPGCHYKVHVHKLTAGKTYIIELLDRNRITMDPYLRMEDAAGKVLMQDDDSGGSNNARIIFACTKDDDYRLIATTFSAGATGSYQVTIQPVPAGAIATGGGFMGVNLPLTVGDVTVTALPSFGRMQNTGSSDPDSHGYVEYRFLIENDSETESHHVKLTLPRDKNQMRYGRYLKSLTKSVDVGPGGAVVVALFQPDLPLIGMNQAEVEIDGKAHPQGVSFSLSSSRGTRSNFHGGGMRTFLMAMVLVQNQELGNLLRQHVVKSAVGVPHKPPPSGGYNSYGITYHELGPYYKQSATYYESVRFHPPQATVDGWSKNWLGYTSYDGVALTGDAWLGAPAEVQTAIAQYVECGGTLLLIGAAKLPDGWARAKQDELGFTRYYPGFGQCIVATKLNYVTRKVDVATWDPDDWRMVLGMWHGAAQSWQQVRNPTAANTEFEVVEGLAIPVRGLFVVMVVFVLVIGPINIYWLARSRRRIWLLWTVPALSLLTCVVLVAYMVTTEGWHGHARSQSITVLDESSQRAATIGWQGYYCPVTPASGLHFPADVELTPHLSYYGSSYRSTRHAYDIDWTSEQRLGDGWVTAKVPAHFMVRRSEKRLERLTLHKHGDGSLAAVNGLGADVTSLWLADAEGNIYTASDVRAGAEAKLVAMGKQVPPANLSKLGDGFSSSWLRLAGDAAAQPHAYLRPGCYIAVLDESPFLDQGLRRTQTRRMQSVVFGILKEAP